MKSEYILLSMIILGPSFPRNDIDVYLQPLIAELKKLWEVRVETYDIVTNQTFMLRATLLWTIIDFLGLSMLSTWSTKGKSPLAIIILVPNISNTIVRCVIWVIEHFYLMIIHIEEIKNSLMVKRSIELHLLPYQAYKFLKNFVNSIMFLGRAKRKQKNDGPWKKIHIF